MNAYEIKFSVVKYKAGYYWSKKKNRKIWMDDIKSIVYEDEGLPVPTSQMTFLELIDFISKNPGADKKSRNAIMKVTSDRFPLKDFVDMSHWNGSIYADLDLDKDPIISNLDEEHRKLLYENLDYALKKICPQNYAYIEHSSSGVGIHIIFYFDCERSQKNYEKYARYVFNIFRYYIDNYIKDFSHIFTDQDCLKANGRSQVFDDVYSRPYQKLFMTCKDYKIYNVSGDCCGIVVEGYEEDKEEQAKKQKEEIKNGKFDVKYITSSRKYTTDYYDRLYIITALKRYVGDLDICRMLWYKFCEDLTLYKSYTTQQFKNMLDQNWNKIKEDTGRIEVLKKYGFNIDARNIHFHLKQNEYVYDVLDDIIKFCDYGINLLIAGTGVGKTEVWKKYNYYISDFMNIPYHKPILVVEPMNSIINSKYDELHFRVITGSKKFSAFNGYEMVITNYNHLLRYTADGVEVKQDAKEFFSQFELIVVDESHIMMKDTFRSDVLIPFMMTLNEIKDTKVIIQTASPLFEQTTLDIKKTITIHKEEKSNTKIIYREVKDDKFDISKIICLVQYYIKNGKKTYIYWKDGSLQNMMMLKKMFPEAMVIYHKRDAGSEDMESINETHKLDDVNVIISSVYFGVGNDLNDEIDDAAVIVIGNNIWQEDIQAKGRWRNAKNIEMCIILLPKDMQLINASKKHPFDYADRLNKVESHLWFIYNDSYNRDKSVIIAGQTFNLKNEEYIEYVAKMQVANEYSCQFCVKNKEFARLGYDVREEIKPLESNDDWIEELKKHKKDLKDIRNTIFKEMLASRYDWNKINKDSSIERCAKIIRQMQYRGLIQYCNLDKFVKNKILRYDTFLKYYNKKILDRNDYAELFSILWVRDHIKDVHEETHKKFSDVEISSEDYHIICGYLMWLIYRNKNDNKKLIKSDYYAQYRKTAIDMINIEESLIKRIFSKNAYHKEYNDFLNGFFGFPINIKDESISKDNLIEEIMKIDTDERYLAKAINKIIEYHKTHGSKNAAGKKGGEKGGKKTKKCIVTDKFKNPEKYNLNIGQEFDSCKALSEYTKKSIQTVSQWKYKEWIG